MLKVIVTIGAIQMLTILVNFLRSKTMAVLLGPQGVGIVSVIDQFTQLVVQISAVGLPFAAVKFLSRSHSRGHAAFCAMYSGLLRLLLAMAGGGALVGLALLYIAPGWLGRELLAYRGFLVPALLAGPLFALHGFFVSVFAAAQQPRWAALLTLAIAVSVTTGVCIGIFTGGIIGLYWGIWFASLAVVVGVALFLRVRLGLPLMDRGASVRGELSANRDLLPFSLILYSTSFAYVLAYFVARYAVLRSAGEGAAGLLQAAIALSGILYAVLTPTNGLYLTPILNRDIPRDVKVRTAGMFQGRLMLVTGAIAMLIVLFPRGIVSLLFSDQFIEVSQVLFIFVIAQCFVQLSGVTQALLIGFNDLAAFGAIVTVGHIGTAALSWLLVPRYGIMGVGLALLTSSAAVFLFTLGRVSLSHRLAMPAGLRVLIVYVFAAVAVMGWLMSHTTETAPAGMAEKLALYLAFIAGLCLLIDRTDRTSLLREFRRLRMRLA